MSTSDKRVYERPTFVMCSPRLLRSRQPEATFRRHFGLKKKIKGVQNPGGHLHGRKLCCNSRRDNIETVQNIRKWLVESVKKDKENKTVQDLSKFW